MFPTIYRGDEELCKLIEKLGFQPKPVTKAAQMKHGVKYHNLQRVQAKTDDLESSDYESMKFLWNLVETSRPQIMIETGSYYGVTAAILGTLFSSHGRPEGSKLHTVEYAPFKKRHIKKNLKLAGSEDGVVIHIDDSIKIDWAKALNGQKADFAFIDCEYRDEAAAHAVPHIKKDGFLMVHDWLAYPEFQQGFEKLVKKGKLRGHASLPIGRGFGIFGVN
jgi:predicted O-methyltransferase YrrM